MRTEYGYSYQPTDLEDELLLADVPLEILVESLETQFKNPFEYRKKDYIQSFITKYEFAKDNMMEEDLSILEVQRDRFFNNLQELFMDFLSIGFDDFEDRCEEDQNEIMHLTYRFFLKNIRKNFVNVIINYIYENHDEIVEKYEKKKDVTAMTFKSEIDDEGDVIILSNLRDIIQDILSYLKSCNDVDHFLRLCHCNEYILENEFVEKCFEDFTLTGNFIEKYIEMIEDEFEYEIQSKVRNKILKKYPFRLNKNEIKEMDITGETQKIVI